MTKKLILLPVIVVLGAFAMNAFLCSAPAVQTNQTPEEKAKMDSIRRVVNMKTLHYMNTRPHNS